MKCRRVQPQLLDFSTGRLEAGAARVMTAHLERCADCRRVLKREQRTAALLGVMGRVEPRIDAWPAIEVALRTCRALAHRRPFWWQPMLWAGGLTATAALTVSLLVPAFQPPPAPVEPDPLSALAPKVAAGLVPERSNDPLILLQMKLDRALDRVADDGS
jgi:anti-sigma-K factor RskA